MHTWNRPPRFTTMHRPGIASVIGDTIILDGTTMEEVEKYHLETLKLCVEKANEEEARLAEQDRIREEREQAEAEAHQREVEDIADRLDFD